MNHEQLIELVAEMRQAQKDYFAGRRNPDAKARLLQKSKHLEKQVDQAIEAAKRPGLFGGG